MQGKDEHIQTFVLKPERETNLKFSRRWKGIINMYFEEL
jgi:hypothetical protein